jgi:hypothetical protein
MNNFTQILICSVISIIVFCTYLDLKSKLSSSQTKIESLEASIVEKDRLLLVAEVKDLLLKDIKDKNMNCIDILRGEDLNSIRYVKMLEYRVDSLQNHLYDLKRF